MDYYIIVVQDLLIEIQQCKENKMQYYIVSVLLRTQIANTCTFVRMEVLKSRSSHIWQRLTPEMCNLRTHRPW